MTQLDSAITALPYVGIHLDDDRVPGAALPAALESPSAYGALAVLGLAPARPPLSDEDDEEGPHDPGGDDDEEEDEDEEGDEDDDEESDEDEEGDEDDEEVE